MQQPTFIIFNYKFSKFCNIEIQFPHESAVKPIDQGMIMHAVYLVERLDREGDHVFRHMIVIGPVIIEDGETHEALANRIINNLDKPYMDDDRLHAFWEEHAMDGEAPDLATPLLSIIRGTIKYASKRKKLKKK